MHKCKSIVFKCIDFRLTKETIRFLEENNMLGDCDIVSLAGSSKSLADGKDETKALLLKQIKTSKDLHGAREVVLIHHSDCGAYKSAFCFASDEDEKKTQLEDMDKVEKIIKEKFPEVEIKKVWARMKDSEGKEVEFSILN
jgi:carbonic anhydrase